MISALDRIGSYKGQREIKTEGYGSVRDAKKTLEKSILEFTKNY